MQAKSIPPSRKFLQAIPPQGGSRRRWVHNQSHFRLAVLALLIISTLSTPAATAWGDTRPDHAPILASAHSANLISGSAALSTSAQIAAAKDGKQNAVCYISASLGEFIGLLLLFGACLAALAIGMRLVLRGGSSNGIGRAICI